MKKKVFTTLDFGMSAISLAVAMIQTIITQDIKMFVTYYCLLVGLLCIVSLIAILEDLPIVTKAFCFLLIRGLRTIGRMFINFQIAMNEKTLSMWKSL